MTTRFNKTLLTALFVMTVGAAFAVPFTPGNFVVTQIGDGNAALVGAATPTFLKEFDSNGNLVQTIAINGTGAGAKLTNSGTATSEGFLTLGGGALWLAGYNAEIGTPGGAAVGGTGTSTSIPNSTAAIINRTIGKVDMNGNVNLTTMLNESYSLSNPRAATSDGTNIWAVGTNGSGQNATGGIRSLTLGASTATQVSGSPVNIRVVNIYNGQLYASASSGAFLGVFSVGIGLPTGSGETCTLLAGLPDTSGVGNASVYDFAFSDANTLYMCDDRSIANGGGLVKWTFNGSAWVLAYKITGGLGTVGVRSICQIGGTAANPTFAVITGEGPGSATRLMTVTDNGSGLDTFNLVTTSPANTCFRGVEKIPASAQRTISGNVVLQDWDGLISGPSVVFEVVDGSQTTVDTHTLNLDGSGNYSFNTSAPAGTYDIYAKASHWLRRKVASVVVSGSGATNVNYSLINGDLDEDNEIAIGDYALLSAFFGGSGPDGDITGDDSVDIGDYAILSANFGLAGD
jgi:hypothetical protein